MKTILFALTFFLPVMLTGQHGFRIVPDVVYGHKAGMALTYDVFVPGDSANGAGVIHVVSGGWNSRYFEPDSVAENYRFLLDEGYVVFALRHGSNPQFSIPEATVDVIAGAGHIRRNSGRYGVDSLKLGIFGGSSGGQLALMAALSPDQPLLGAAAAFFAPADLRNVPDFIRAMIPALDFDTTLAASVSPATFASPGDPPTLLIHGTKDFVVAPWQSEKMYAALQENGVESKLVIYEGMMHGNSYGGKGKFLEKGNTELLDWFGQHLLGKKASSSP